MESYHTRTWRKIGVYGGTFDPIHIGHVIAAEAVRELVQLDCVLFVPNNTQPLKAHEPWATADQRLRMIRAAIAGNSAFDVSLFELEHPAPSYTITTLDALRAKFPNSELRFILGVDAVHDLGKWREPQRILQDYRPVVMSRGGFSFIDWSRLLPLHPEATQLVDLIEVPNIHLSSRHLRAQVAEGRSIRYRVPEAVWHIIDTEGLYR